jgi:hypothetical protein
MPVGELTERMSAHELAVTWPAFFRHRQRERDREEERQRAQQARKRSRR